jgi:hypothetical protein
VRRAYSLLGWFAVLEVVWAVLVGTTQSTELLVGLLAAAAGSCFAEVLRSRGLLDFEVDGSLLAKAWKLPWLVPFDFLVVTWVLARALAQGRRVRGEWVRVPFATAPGARGGWGRAFAATASNGAANALVVDLDGDEAVLHALEPRVFSGRTVL